MWWKKIWSGKNSPIADQQRALPAVEREARAELDQEALDVIDQGLFEVALSGVLGQLQEVEDVGVLGRLKQRLPVWRTEHLSEIRQLRLPDARAAANWI